MPFTGKFPEGCKVITGFVPVDIQGGKTGTYVSLKNYNKCAIIVQMGAVAATCNITVNKATAVAPTGATSFAFDEYYYDTANTGALTRATGAAGTIATGTTANCTWIIDVDAEDLGDTYDCLAVIISDPAGSSAVIMSAVYVLYEPRYAQSTPPSAIVD